jgi:hypothetical protein
VIQQLGLIIGVFNEEIVECYTVYETVTGTGYINGLKYWNLNFGGSEITFLEGVGYMNTGRAIFAYCQASQFDEEYYSA